MRRMSLLVFFLALSLLSLCAYSYDELTDSGYQPEYGYAPSPDSYSSHDYANDPQDYAPRQHYAMNPGNGDYYYQGYPPPPRHQHRHRVRRGGGESYSNASGRMPSHIAATGEKVIIVNPNVHAFGAYDASGNLVRTGIATSGNSYCRDTHRRCRTSSGSFRIYSLGSASCKSTRYPVGKGGAPMPYCMYFNKNMALHGSYEVHDANVSHGCVRLHVADAEWLRFNFARVGTKVVVKPY